MVIFDSGIYFILVWKTQPRQKKYYDTQGAGKVLENFMEHLKEINNRGNIYEQKLYDSNGNEELLHLMQIQKSLIYFVSALRSNELLIMKMQRTIFFAMNEEEMVLIFGSYLI